MLNTMLLYCLGGAAAAAAAGFGECVRACVCVCAANHGRQPKCSEPNARKISQYNWLDHFFRRSTPHNNMLILYMCNIYTRICKCTA